MPALPDLIYVVDDDAAVLHSTRFLLESEGLRVETFTGCRLQAQADHLAALTRCGSLKDAFELQTAFLTRSMADYQAEARTLSHEVVEAASAEGVSKAA